MSIAVLIIIHNIIKANSVGLVVDSTCVPFNSISSHREVSGQFHQIGWIKVISCIETLFINHTFNSFTIHRDDYSSLSSRAISIKFQPPGGTNNTDYDNLAVIAKPYSNPIRYGLNNNKEVSYTYTSTGNISGYATTTNWIGTPSALARLNQWGCYGRYNAPSTPGSYRGYPTDFHERIYHACGNSNGFHISPNRDDTVHYRCSWDNLHLFGNDIEIHFGFVPEDCETKSPIEIPTNPPSIYPTMSPSHQPTTSPTKTPTYSPSIYPTVSPSHHPTESPTKIPTNSPSIYPTVSPSHQPTTSPTKIPTNPPSVYPTVSPSHRPTVSPTKLRTTNLSMNLSTSLSINPTKYQGEGVIDASPDDTQPGDTNIYNGIIMVTFIFCVFTIVIIFIWLMFKKKSANRSQKDMDMIAETKEIEVREHKNTATTSPNPGAANVDIYETPGQHHDLPINYFVNINLNVSTIPVNISHNATNMHLGEDNKKPPKNDQQDMEGPGTMIFIQQEKEDSSDDSDLFGLGTGTGINTGTTAKEIINYPKHSSDRNAFDDRALPMGTTNTGEPGEIVENVDDTTDNFGDV